MAVANLRQVLVLLLSPLSTSYGGGGCCWQAGGLAGWPADPSSQPFTQEGEWGVEVVGAQLGKTSTHDGGLQCTDYYQCNFHVHVYAHFNNFGHVHISGLVHVHTHVYFHVYLYGYVYGYVGNRSHVHVA